MMWMSKLNDMSVGPLWVLRKRDASGHSEPAATTAVCPTCGEAWLQAATSEIPVVAIVGAPMTDPAQQTLLQNCLHAAGWSGVAVAALHTGCADTADAAMTALQPHLAGATTLIVFGEAAAQRLSPEFSRGRVHHFHNARLIVTCHPEQMLADPTLKAAVWADLCLAAHDA
jgi:hypothetical protein